MRSINFEVFELFRLRQHINSVPVDENRFLSKAFLTCFLEPLYKLLLIPVKKRLASKGAQFVPIGMPTVCRLVGWLVVLGLTAL